MALGFPRLHAAVEVRDRKALVGEEFRGLLRATTKTADHDVLSGWVEFLVTLRKLRERDEQRARGKAEVPLVVVADVEEQGTFEEPLAGQERRKLRDLRWLAGHEGLSCHDMEARGDSPVLLDVGQLLDLLDGSGEVEIVDVREPDEFAAWSIPGALNIPLADVAARSGELGHGLVVVVCSRGARAAEASAVLFAQGRDSVVLDGGMAAWAGAYDDVAMRVGQVTVVQVRRRGKGCLSYVVGVGSSCLVIDPSLDIERILAVARGRGWRVSFVADTHLHADHLSGATLLAETTGATLLGGAVGRDGAAGSEIVLDQATGVTIDAIATPGHTPGSTTYALGDLALFTGDTLFIESVGRPDLADKAEEYAASLHSSLRDVIFARRDETLIFPAHFGPSVAVTAGVPVAATLGELRRTLPALALDEVAFVAWAAGRVTTRPPNYETIVEANAASSRIDALQRDTLELGPNRCAVDTPA